MKKSRAASHDGLAERAALVTVVSRASGALDTDVTLDELAGLARAAGAQPVLRLSQERGSLDAATLLGRGKAETLARACAEASVSLVIVDNELTPAQGRNLEKLCACRVIDRTQLILDIFARRARTREGKLQVELAQLQYLLPRLTGAGAEMSRLGGGIGTRGPGETKLETDRRRIRQRLAALKRDIAEVRRRRGYLRGRRRRADVPTVALVGYTNAGKTTLFNVLTGADAVTSDALFVTLDPLMRRMRLADRRQILIVDTVGFIDRLPHQLVASFHATLEEVNSADLLLHVIDASAPDRNRRAEAVESVLREIDADKVPMLEVFNKVDLLSRAEVEGLKRSQPDAILVSAASGLGRAAFVERITAKLSMDAERVRLELDTNAAGDRALVADLYRHAKVVSHVHTDDRVSIEADIPRRLLDRFTRARVPA